MFFRVTCVTWLYLAIGTVDAAAFFQQNNNHYNRKFKSNNRIAYPRTVEVLSSATAIDASPAVETSSSIADDEESSSNHVLTKDLVSKLTWRDLQKALEERNLSTEGTTGVLRERLRNELPAAPSASGYDDDEFAVINGKNNAECMVDMSGIDFVDQSDPDYEFKDLLRQVKEKATMGHWKTATRRLKRLNRVYVQNGNVNDEVCIPPDLYTMTLEACVQDRLHGARAAETARKIMETMVDQYYDIPAALLNNCIYNCIGDDNNSGKHQGFGGVDTALAMIAAVSEQEKRSGESLITAETYDKVIGTLAREGGSSVDDALKLLRSIIVDKSVTPMLSTFASVAKAEVLAWSRKSGKQKQQVDVQLPTADDNLDDEEIDTTIGPEKVFNVLAYVKAAGYDLETIASTKDGRDLLASGVIAANRVDSIGVGLRLLKAASAASGCAPDRGDILVSLSSPTAQRACSAIHKRAINSAVSDGKWKLAVKLLETMLDRSLKPSAMIWRNVVTCCAKQEKSKKAGGLLMDWVKLYEQGKAEQPPLYTFNTVINACELCGEQELTLEILELMKRTHNTDGNIITFNIALKRLARLGNYWAPEGIVVGMIENGVAPTVVTFTTAIAACAAAKPKEPKRAYEWMKRMRSLGIKPNVITYQTALSACLDGTLESSLLGSKIAKEMLEQVDEQLIATADNDSNERFDKYTSALPDYATKAVARQLMKQLKENWLAGEINKQDAVSTVRIPLLNLVEFSKSKAAAEAAKRQEKAEQLNSKKGKKILKDIDDEVNDELQSVSTDELDLEFANVHRTAEV